MAALNQTVEPQDSDAVEEFLHELDDWERAYPLSAFPEPDLKKAADLLKAGGMTLDSISASNMRHVVSRIAPKARAIIAARLEAPITEDALAWFGENTRLELSHYAPVYWDDYDQAVEWRVHERRGSINDREWELRGRGATPLLAIQDARAALQALHEKKGQGQGYGE